MLRENKIWNFEKWIPLTYNIDRTSNSQSATPSKIPIQDQQMALCLLLELSVQRGSLSHVLSAVLLLLNLWNNGCQESDNRISSGLNSAPLIHLLQRFQAIKGAKPMVYWEKKTEFVNENSCNFLFYWSTSFLSLDPFYSSFFLCFFSKLKEEQMVHSLSKYSRFTYLFYSYFVKNGQIQNIICLG